MWHPEPVVRHSIPEAHWPTAEEAARALLFQPVRVGRVELESRTWVPAMVPWGARGGARARGGGRLAPGGNPGRVGALRRGPPGRARRGGDRHPRRTLRPAA